MPALISGKVLVTGANGFIAVWVVKTLLEEGFSVRGTVRSENKARYLRDFFKAYSDRLEIVVVEDITKEGAFDVAAQDVDAILHTASPLNASFIEPDEIILPAVNGTMSVLNSALLHRTTVKRVVVLSSTAAIFSPPPPGHSGPRHLDEHDWNEHSVKEVREKGRDASRFDKYRASKSLAERAAWEIYEREKKTKGELGWELVTLNPPYVYGPIVHEVPTLESFNGTSRQWYDHVVKGDLEGDALTKDGGAYVDVRDLAHAHVLALTVPEAGGERFIITKGTYVWQQFVDAARKFSDDIPRGDPSYSPEKSVFPSFYNGEKSRKVLGIEYRSMDDTVKDSLEDFRRRGWF